MDLNKRREHTKQKAHQHPESALPGHVTSENRRERSAEIKSPGAFCPECGDPTLPGGDICEKCHEWLLGFRCVFCYEPFAPEQAFCGECGNPPIGITCECGTTSIFDFCPSCDTPLTEMGVEVLNGLRMLLLPDDRDEAVEDSRSNLKTLSVNLQDRQPRQRQEQPPSGSIDSPSESFLRSEQELGLDTPDVVAPKEEPSAEATKPSRLEAEWDSPAPRQATADPDREQDQLLPVAGERTGTSTAKDRAARRREEKASQRAAARKEMRRKNFSSNQEARRHHAALKLLLPKIVVKMEEVTETVLTVAGWRCYAFKTLHRVPQDCARPDQGGEWEGGEEVTRVVGSIAHTTVTSEEVEL